MFYFIISLITSPAQINPATDGTNEILAKTFSSDCGFIGISFEYTTFNLFIPLFFNSFHEAYAICFTNKKLLWHCFFFSFINLF